MKKVTIYDVAKLANCSTATVSLVFSGSPRIYPSTCQRVKEIAKQIGYTPNYIAQSLSKKSTNTIGVIIPNIDNPLFSQTIAGIESYANSKGYNLILGLSDSNRNKESFYLEMLQRERVDGLLVLPTFMDLVIEKLNRQNPAQAPVVLCGSSGNRSNISMSYAKCNNHIGARLATNHLIETGRRRIGCIFPVFNEQQYLSRKTGYEEALAQNDIPFDENLIKICTSDNDAIFSATQELIKEQKPDSIFCLYDYAAISVMRAIHSMGLRIPDDISVIGYDNIPISNYLPTPLSTIDTRSKLVGEKAAELLVNKIMNPDTPVQQITIEPELVVRDSTFIQ